LYILYSICCIICTSPISYCCKVKISSTRKGGGVGGEGGRPLGFEQAEFEPYEPITQAIKIAIAAFSLLLLGLSVSAYRKTHLRRLVYAAVAFGWFALQLFFDYLEDAIPAFDTPYSDIIFFGITLAILVLFFMAIVKKK
jgi:hypothetical protein